MACGAEIAYTSLTVAGVTIADHQNINKKYTYNDKKKPIHSISDTFCRCTR